MLDRSVLRDLNTLGPKADSIAMHLVAAGSLVDDDPQRALAHVRYARDQAPRIAAVREAAGIVAYQAGEWAEAARDLRACRRMTGDASHLPVIADCERALGRADRAISLATSPEASDLPRAVQAELVIVHSGARRDLGEVDGALLLLERFGLDRAQLRPWSARLWYAYADALLDADRVSEAREWFSAAAEQDHDGTTDAAERLAGLDAPQQEPDEPAHSRDDIDDDRSSTADTSSADSSSADTRSVDFSNTDSDEADSADVDSSDDGPSTDPES